MSLTQRFVVGVVTKPHGLKGEVSVYATTDDPERFHDLDSVLLDTERGELKELTIERVKVTPKGVLLKFQGYDRIEDVERFRAKKLYIRRDQAVTLEEGEYFIPDLIGLTVYDFDTGEVIGTLKDVITTGANDVFEVERADGKGNVLLPRIEECIREIRLDKECVRAHMMPGLLD